MQVRTVGQGPHPDFGISGSVVTVAGVEIDAAARQTDAQQIIDIRTSGGTAQEGGSGYQLASIQIPPRRYVVTEGDATDEDGADGSSREATPLDTQQVKVTIWSAV